MLLKNMRAHSLDVGGRMLTSGETADLDETSPVVAEAVASEHLAPADHIQAPARAATRPKQKES